MYFTVNTFPNDIVESSNPMRVAWVTTRFHCMLIFLLPTLLIFAYSIEEIRSMTCLEEGLCFCAEVSIQQLAQCDPIFMGDLGKQTDRTIL